MQALSHSWCRNGTLFLSSVVGLPMRPRQPPDSRSSVVFGADSNCTFLCTSDEEVAFSAAILRLWASGYVEPVQPERDAFHILAQQTLALCLQENGLPVSDWWAWLSGAACFSEVTDDERRQLLAHMLERGILSNHDGRLWLGELREKLYARRNFEALYAVFEARASLDVVCGPEEIGSIDAQFVQGLDSGSAFVLAGKAWKVVNVEWRLGRCEVVPAPKGQHATWFGGARLRSRRQCEALREVLRDDVRPRGERPLVDGPCIRMHPHLPERAHVRA